MKNIEKYKGIVLKHLSHCDIETDIRKQGGKAAIDCHHTSCYECQEMFFKWLLEEYREPILDNEEKDYLSAVIKPFRSRVKYIAKIISYDEFEQRIKIAFYNGYCTYLPYFKANTMYKGMETDKNYTLKELGL